MTISVHLCHHFALPGVKENQTVMINVYVCIYVCMCICMYVISIKMLQQKSFEIVMFL